MRCGIIGTGAAARLLHWPALKELKPRYSIQAVSNRTLSKAESFANDIGLSRESVYTDYRPLLERTDIDTVILALPPKLNYEVTESAMQAGKHVICEKPIAAALEDAEKMVDLPGRYGKSLLIAENFRYEKSISECKRILKEGAIGTVFMMLYKWMQFVPENDEIASRPWRKESGLPGGFLCDHGIHMIDVVRYLLGEISDIQVYGSDLFKHVIGIDTASFNLRIASGSTCSIQWSFAAPTNDIFTIEIWGSEGHLIVSPNAVEIHSTGRSRTIGLTGKRSSFYYEFLDFHEAITNDKEPVMSLQEGVKDLEAVYAAYESVKTGQSIRLT